MEKLKERWKVPSKVAYSTRVSRTLAGADILSVLALVFAAAVAAGWVTPEQAAEGQEILAPLGDALERFAAAAFALMAIGAQLFRWARLAFAGKE